MIVAIIVCLVVTVVVLALTRLVAEKLSPRPIAAEWVWLVLDVCPRLAAHNLRDIRLSQAVLICQLVLRNASCGVALADLNDDRLIQFCVVAMLAPLRSLARLQRALRTALQSFRMRSRSIAVASSRPSSFDHAAQVTSIRISQEMRGAYATDGATIAQVRNEGCFGMGLMAGCQNVGNNVSAAYSVPEEELAVAVVITGGSPDPTGPKFRTVNRNRTVFVDLGPEAFFYWTRPTEVESSGHRSDSFGVSRPRQLTLCGGFAHPNYTHYQEAA
jgi:hypothetical protein